jgi:hypothetical protein
MCELSVIQAYLGISEAQLASASQTEQSLPGAPERRGSRASGGSARGGTGAQGSTRTTDGMQGVGQLNLNGHRIGETALTVSALRVLAVLAGADFNIQGVIDVVRCTAGLGCLTLPYLLFRFLRC